MRNREQWAPSKYICDGQRWKAARDPDEVGAGSRLLGDLVAALYAENIRMYVSGQLLDLGCGKAPFYAMYRPYIYDAICADWPNTRHGDTFVDVQCDLNEGLPFPANTFDTVLLSDVLEHLPEPLHLWSEMARVMKPGATLLMNTPFFYWLHERPFDYYRYTEFALRRFAELTGFKVTVLRAVGGSPAIIADLLAKHLQFVPGVGVILADVLQQAVFSLIATNLGKHISMTSAEVFPFGYFLVAQRSAPNPG
jgi:SAM-dependent methyltransferase